MDPVLVLKSDLSCCAFQLFWKTIPVTVKDGVATVKFDLSDSVTTFRAMADVLTKDGLLGQGDALIDCQLPTYAEVKLPVELTVGDVAQVPVTVIIPALGKSEGGAALVTMEYRTSDGLQIKDASQAVRVLCFCMDWLVVNLFLNCCCDRVCFLRAKPGRKRNAVT